MKAVVLLSGGLDSATASAIAKSQGYELYALTFDYGQRHRKELDCARKVAGFLAMAAHQIIPLTLPTLNSSLLNRDIPIPESSHNSRTIPTTYVPGRNLIFLAMAASYAEGIGSRDIFAGMNAVDYSGYPDCRPEFVQAFQIALNLGTKAGVEGSPFTLHTPLMRLSKSEIIRRGLALGLDYSLTWSCYRGEEEACGHCDSCRLRLQGFQKAGVKDPLKYANQG